MDWMEYAIYTNIQFKISARTAAMVIYVLLMHNISMRHKERQLEFEPNQA